RSSNQGTRYTSQINTVLSALPVASNRPSGENTKAVTGSTFPWRRRRSLPLAVSHSSAPSSLKTPALATVRPSGENTTQGSARRAALPFPAEGTDCSRCVPPSPTRHLRLLSSVAATHRPPPELASAR